MGDDKVWWSGERRLNGICDEIAAARAWRGNVLVLAYFANTLAGLESALRSRLIDYHPFSVFDPALCAAGDDAGQVWIGLAQSLQPPAMHPPNQSSAAYLDVIVAEHHPLRSYDERLIQAAFKIPCRTTVSFHVSLDDPLIVHFCGNSIQRLFKQLGASEVDSLSSPMITTAIRQAQEKIERQVPRDLAAQSIDDWFDFNLPAQ